MNNNIQRHSKGAQVAGQKTGGQFKQHERADATFQPADTTTSPFVHKTQHDVHQKVAETLEQHPNIPHRHQLDGKTKWGEIQYVENLGNGIQIVSTPSHGGTYLPPEINRHIPAPLRNRDGWYEEDCEAMVPLLYFPEEHSRGQSFTPERATQMATESIKNWYPHEWEKVTGEKVGPEESSVIAEQQHKEKYYNAPVTHAAEQSATDPDMVVVHVRRASDNKQGKFLVPRDEYETHGTKHGMPIDPTRHKQLADIPEPVLEPPKPVNQTHNLTNFDTSKLTPAAQKAFTKDMNQRWKNPETGAIRSLQHIIENEGVTERVMYLNSDGTAEYAITTEDSYSYRIKKSTYTALENTIPDGDAPSKKATQKILRTRHKIEKLNQTHLLGYERIEQRAKLQHELEQHTAEQERLIAIEREQFIQTYGDEDTRQRAREEHKRQTEWQAALNPDW